jgi:iron complex outermembrane receptor protein
MQRRAIAWWLGSVAGAALGVCGSASAQAPGQQLEEVVVTATRQTSSANKVPLTISAVTARELSQQNIRTAQDLATAVPALRITPESTNGMQISVRGIASAQGAATTGIYLDDTPLQRRAGSGAINGIGVAFPQIFDLDRVEVLKGPQGTLYGGSAEGGAVRLITPTPSLTAYSVYGRAQIATTEDGAPSGEAGIAVGGPLVQGKLGLRLSAWDRHTGGYIDHVNRFTGHVLATDTNWRDDRAFRIAARWQVTDTLTVTPAYYYTTSYHNDGDFFWENVAPFTQGARYYTSAGAATTAGAANVAFTYPAHSYPGYDFYGPGKTGTNQCAYADGTANDSNVCVARYTRQNILSLPSLTIDYQMGGVDLKSITSFIDTTNTGTQPMYFNSLATANAGNEFVFNLPYVSSVYYYGARGEQVTQEFRASSTNPDARFTWVAGAYYSDGTTHSNAYAEETEDQYNRVLKGIGLTPAYAYDINFVAFRDQYLRDQEAALFGEANYMITDKLKATAGARVSRTRFAFNANFGGPALGYLVPTTANGGVVSGAVTETPVTPHFGLSYALDPTKMLYVSIAEGYRAGGVNPGPSLTRCAGDLAALGITSTPTTYASDSVWSYEGGAKLRLLDGAAQVNASAFLIDWKSPQTNFGLPSCGFSYVINAGHAVSQGAELQSQVALAPGLTANLQVAYTDAHYTESVLGPAPTSTTFIVKGDRLPGAPWSATLGGQYRFRLGGGPQAYVRADYRYTSAYQSGPSWPSSVYRLEQLISPETRLLNLRAGVSLKGWDVALFVDNATNSQDRIGNNLAYHTGCSDASCGSFRQYFPVGRSVTFTPRTVGLNLEYRY